MSPESENESLITVKGRQAILLFLSDSFVTQGEFHKCTCSSPPQNGSSNRRAVTVAGAASTQGIGIRWQTSHKSRRSQPWRRTATRSQAWSLDSCYGHFPQLTGMRVMSTPLLLLRWPFIQSCILSSFTNEWVTWYFTFTHPNLSISTHNPLVTLSVGICSNWPLPPCPPAA